MKTRRGRLSAVGILVFVAVAFRPRAAWASLGPFFSLGSQWSPTFSNECFSEASAIR